jgi:hypothetical protein
MTKWQLGQHDAARQLLSDTQPAIDQELQTPTTIFEYRVTLEVLRRDAESLIKPKETDEGAETNKVTPTTQATTDH